MYRSRMGGGDLDKITLGYVSSIQDDQEIVIYDILGSQAHVLMLLECQIIKRGDAQKILTSLENLKKSGFLDAYTDKNDDDAVEDIHELVESLVIKEAGMESGGRMHTARSRNDQVSLDIRMKIRDDINTICDKLLDTAEAFVSVAQVHSKTIMPLYTHLQQAQAGVFSHWLLAHTDAILRDYERLYSAFERVNQSPLGAGPVGGTSLSIDRDVTSKMLGFDGIVENSLDATSTRDFALEYVAAASIMMVNLSRICEDLVVWSTSEFGFVELADEFASPSSVMPQKKNPDILELTRAKAAEVAGGLAGILGATKGLASGYGRDLQQIKPTVWSTSKTLLAALQIVRSAILTITLDTKKMKKVAESGNLVALDIAEELVRLGIPFRVTHKVAGALAQTAYKSNTQIKKLEVSKIVDSVKGTDVEPGVVLGIVSSVSVHTSLRDRVSRGSSGYKEQKKMITNRLCVITKRRALLLEREAKIDKAIKDLENQVHKIISKHPGS